jgi:hypothetical protein
MKHTIRYNIEEGTAIIGIVAKFKGPGLFLDM